MSDECYLVNRYHCYVGTSFYLVVQCNRRSWNCVVESATRKEAFWMDISGNHLSLGALRIIGIVGICNIGSRNVGNWNEWLIIQHAALDRK